jgi:hypothetical protein
MGLFLENRYDVECSVPGKARISRQYQGDKASSLYPGNMVSTIETLSRQPPMACFQVKEPP